MKVQLSEGEFWRRYFSSKLFNRHRASSRQAGDSIKDDPIFDAYLTVEDDHIEPQANLETEHIYRLLDLASTEEDHGETGNQQDYTMRAGTQRAALPLMRRFNQHSERMLDQSLCVATACCNSTSTHGTFGRGKQTNDRSGHIYAGDAGVSKHR